MLVNIPTKSIDLYSTLHGLYDFTQRYQVPVEYIALTNFEKCSLLSSPKLSADLFTINRIFGFEIRPYETRTGY